ncbi:MAG: ferritin-like domain-containing protein [Saprospiraceae bacterium]
MKQPNGKSSEQKSFAKKESSSSKATMLQELFEDELKDIYWAEKALTKAIPKMIGNATSQELIEALEGHLEVTEQQVARCEEIFESIGVKAVAKKCEAMEGLIKEAGEIMESTDAGSVRDAAIISAAQKVEHYEIASYGTLCAFAKQLGYEVAATLLEETLNEEREADTNLSDIAESTINQEAMTEQDQHK